MRIDIMIGEFVWFFGVVEDRNDPLKLGRVRIRAYGWHTEDKVAVPTNTLPWAQTIQPITSAAMGDIGTSPTGIVEGTWVVGYFIDGDDAQKPIIMGTLAGIPTAIADTTKGFSDPAGIYPDRIEEPDVNRLARNEPAQPHPILNNKEANRTTNVSVANGENAWEEPASSYAASYPYNHVTETESGHIREMDDTTDAERIHEYHKAGTFYEIDSDGNKITRIVGDEYEIVAGNKFVNVKGTVNLTIDGDCRTYIKGDWDIQVDGDVFEHIGGDQRTLVDGNIDIDASKIDLN
jgi:hypothetical protein